MSRSGLKILLLADSRAVHVERLTAQLRAQGCRVRPASLEHGALHHAHLPRIGPAPQLHYALSSAYIGLLCDRWRPDLINAHFASGYGFSAALANRNRHLPLVTHLWGSDILIAARKSALHRMKTSFALASSDVVIADSQYLLDAAGELSRAYEGYVFPWGIERRFLALYDEPKPPAPPLKVIVPRTHEPVYNNEMLLRALAPLLIDGRVRLTVPAFGSLADSFRAEANRLGIGNVTFYEKLPREPFLRFMAGHHVFLSAARSDSSPVSLIEAMALGLAPVAMDIPGVREWLDDRSGFRFGVDDTEHLHRIIADLVFGIGAHREMLAANHLRVGREAVYEDNIARQIGIMTELVRRRGGEA